MFRAELITLSKLLYVIGSRDTRVMRVERVK